MYDNPDVVTGEWDEPIETENGAIFTWRGKFYGELKPSIKDRHPVTGEELGLIN